MQTPESTTVDDGWFFDARQESTTGRSCGVYITTCQSLVPGIRQHGSLATAVTLLRVGVGVVAGFRRTFQLRNVGPVCLL